MDYLNFTNTDTSSPFIIAEMSGNHNKSLSKAIEIVDAAAEAGADAIKLQTFTPDTMTLDLSRNEFKINNPNSLWNGESLYALYEKAATPWEWHKPIFERALQKKILAFSSPFDNTSVDFLESLNVPFYKIASFENTYIPLIKKVASTGKPMIISTGMATQEELLETIEIAKGAGCKSITLLKCTSSYPASPEDSNLKTILHMKKFFNCNVGLSDHTMGIGTSIAAVALGATVIERHFTLNRSDGGIDSQFSLEPDEFAQMVKEIKRASLSLGAIKYGPTKSEEYSVTRRRSIYFSEDVKAGEMLTEVNLKCIRPGHGLPTKFYESLLGKVVLRPAKKGDPIDWSYVGEMEL